MIQQALHRLSTIGVKIRFCPSELLFQSVLPEEVDPAAADMVVLPAGADEIILRKAVFTLRRPLACLRFVHSGKLPSEALPIIGPARSCFQIFHDQKRTIPGHSCRDRFRHSDRIRFSEGFQTCLLGTEKGGVPRRIHFQEDPLPVLERHKIRVVDVSARHGAHAALRHLFSQCLPHNSCNIPHISSWSHSSFFKILVSLDAMAPKLQQLAQGD